MHVTVRFVYIGMGNGKGEGGVGGSVDGLFPALHMRAFEGHYIFAVMG